MNQAPAQNPTKPVNILIVEDEQFISDLYVLTLQKAGYAVTVANDGEQALTLAQTDAFDIILLDIMIPNLTGTEILRRLRGTGQAPKIHAKIIVTTNLELAKEAKNNIESQADGYIVKAEVTPRELANFVAQIKL